MSLSLKLQFVLVNFTQCLTHWVWLRPRWNRQHFAEDIFNCIFFNEDVWISIKISLTFVPKGPINNIPALVQIMAWCRPGDNPLSEPTRTTRTPAFWGYPPPPHDYPHYWIPSQKNNRSRTENVTEQTRFSKSRSNDLEDIGQGQRSSHATHLLMLVIICTKYGKNPSRTVDATERTRFSRSTPNDLEDIGQGQRSSHVTHLLMLVIICTKYGKNPSRTVDATGRTRFSKSRPNDLEDIGQGQRSSCATHLLMLVIICTKYGKNPSRTVDATERTRFSRSRPNDLEDIGQGQRSLYATHPLMLVIICAKYGKNPSRIVDFFFQGQGQKV